MPRFLIVDDSLSIQRFLRSVLSDHGEAQTAENGREGVKLFEKALRAEQGFDVVIMDIMMPEMDGLTATKKIRELETSRGVAETGRTRIIMLSCLSDSKHMMEAQFDCGADAYLTKPFEESTLLEALTNFGLEDNPLDDDDAFPDDECVKL